MWRTRLIVFSAVALFVASILLAHVADDWSRFDHHLFPVAGVESGNRINIALDHGGVETVTLLGIVPIDSTAGDWLKNQTAGQQVTLLLQSPQTRDADRSLRAFVFLSNRDLNVELAKAGLAYADRRGKTQMDGLIDAAEGEARRKKRGAWATLSFGQMPAWRQAWVKSLPHGR